MTEPLAGAELTRWAAAFLLTQAVEVPVYLRALRTGALAGRPAAVRFAAAFAASLVTHPFVFLLLPRLWPGSYLGYVAAAEAVAVLVEALWLRAWRVESPLAWSLGANAASTAVGWVCRGVFGWP